jgi:hypothetical protein
MKINKEAGELLIEFNKWLDKNDCSIRWKNWRHVPGEGYSPSEWCEVDFEKLIKKFLLTID